MRYIDLSNIDMTDPDVISWINKAKKHLALLNKMNTHAERKDYMSKHGIWNQFKPILIRCYGEKCWYSECSIQGEFGDVDHFRPKNRSTDERGNVILPDGYWWLAYDYLNYRLSCEKSNRSFGNGGKNDMFPLKVGTLPASFPHNNDIAVLLDPCVEKDVEIIDCDETGEIISISDCEYDIERVAISKKVYNWNEFNSARKDIRNRCKTALENFEIIYEVAPDRMRPAVEQITSLVDSKVPFSSFARRYISLKIIGKPYESVIRQFLL
ncbi:MAG: hypothetical protein J6A16_04455 [Oscillospiraceae bacterium]|nr:hypothetical protein [Oscillospiraceae bacterium]